MPAQSAANSLQQAEMLSKEGRLDEAIPLYENALAGLERINGPEAPELAECLQNLAEAYQSVARYEESLRTNWRLVRIGEKILGRVHPDMVSMLLKIAETNEMMGKTEDALHIVESAIATAKQCMQADNPLAVRLIERHTYLVNLMRTQGASKSQFDDPSQYQGNGSPANSISASNSIPASNSPPAQQLQPSAPSSAEAARMQNSSANQVQIPPQLQQQMQEQMHQQLQQYQGQPISSPGPTGGAYQHPSQVPKPPQPHPMEISQGQSAMQDFAREMLKDMPGPPGSKSPFSQSVNLGNASGVQFEHINPQEALALDPSIAPMPSPPVRPNNIEKASYGNALARPPQDFDEDAENESYTAEAIASLTNRSKVNTRSNVKGRRLSNDEQTRIRAGRLLKDFGLPLVALMVLIGMVYYISNSSKNLPVVKQSAVAAPRGQLTLFEGPDGKKQVRLLGPEVAYLVNTKNTTKVQFKRVGNNWSDYLSIIFSSLTERQLWFEEDKSTLRSEDTSVYYGVDGPENIVLEKMRELGGFAQSYFLRTGEFPKVVPPGAEFAFTYISPYTGKGLTIQVRPVRAKEKDGSDVYATLTGGSYLGNEETATPGYISCYGVTYGDSSADTMRCIKFYVRGCNKDGHFLMNDFDKIFVLIPDNSQLKLKADPAATSESNKNNSRAPKSSKKRKPNISSSNKTADPIPLAKSAATLADKDIYSRAEQAEKQTKMYLIMHPPLPLPVLHHLLPIILAMLTVIAFIRSQMVGFDIKGKAVSTGSNLALVVAIVLFCLFAISVVIQFIVFK